MEPVTGPDLARTWALVPIRGLETAKTRLGGDLDAEERRDLVVDLLQRTLVATRDARRVAGTILVTMDPAAAGIARDHRAVGLVERAPGLNGAITAARSVAVARGATAVLVLPADLPAISAPTVDALLDAADRARAPGSIGLVALITDQHGRGTNALLISPPGRIDPVFGPASRDRHRAAAAAAGATFVELDGPLGLDVDTPDDLELAEAALGAIGG
ncbi:MAG TPA: 2-phospho-L-lactate guanylyltransferase [Candidatus Dormibacteraeota bacterium]|nr:2-phospho-L-lactate guanylyltransferase [Candidatus Dormibacteraeota bacterium]